MKAYATKTCLGVALYKSLETQDVKVPEMKHCCSCCHTSCDGKGNGVCANPFFKIGEDIPKVSKQEEVQTVSKPGIKF